ncbi:MAG TPA: alanine-tRNA synthetase second additional domain-containing protein [Candidatus Ozemobacteraceae bacterium]|nr:alanine-tRNA synthetase second additional domain-containing protein [Candidatus Ozemobacteraceae bacterium]
MSVPFTFNAHTFDTLIYSTYYAPRGRQRLYMLGAELGQRYLFPTDLLVGIIGSEGSGKSTLIRGLFPGLELTNDDEGVNLRPTPIYDFTPDNFFAPHTYHLDIRYELAFHQTFEIAEAIREALAYGRRVVVEHFDLIYDALNMNAHIIFGIGEEVIIARPSVFGPFPAAIKSVVDRTLRFRLMAHTAEDITTSIMERDYNYRRPVLHSDVKHGFVIKFPEKPSVDIHELEQKVLEVIANDVPVAAAGENRIRIGRTDLFCTGTRTHVKSTGLIENFRLVQEYKFNPLSKDWMLIGIVGRREIAGIEELSYFGDDSAGFTAPTLPPAPKGPDHSSE